MQRDVMRAALAALHDAERPGEILELPYRWAETDDWKDGVMRPKPGGGDEAGHEDDRGARLAAPQYQTEEDALLADPECATCVFPDPVIAGGS